MPPSKLIVNKKFPPKSFFFIRGGLFLRGEIMCSIAQLGPGVACKGTALLSALLPIHLVPIPKRATTDNGARLADAFSPRGTSVAALVGFLD